jgi:hypothetical protein
LHCDDIMLIYIFQVQIEDQTWLAVKDSATRRK